MVRTTTRDDEARAEASVSTPDYRLTGVDLVDVSEGDRITFTTTTKRSNGVPLRSGTTLTVDDVTVDEVESTEMVEVEPEWLPDDGMFGCDDDVASASVPRDVIETHVEVVAIDDGTRYTLKQTDTGFVRVSSCDQSDFVDQNERGEWNAVARSNVSHGVLKSWSHDEVVTDGGIIVADDDGEIIDDDEDDDRVDPDDEGVELLTDGGTPTCEACDRDDLTELPDDDNRGAFRCEWCGAFVDEDGRLPRADDKRCPNCHGRVAYGVLKDARKGIRGYLCVGECEERRIVRPEEDAPVATDGGRHQSDVDKCRECGRRAPHAFDHAVGCSRFEPIEDEPVTTYVVDEEYATTDAQEAESFARRGAHVTATTSRSPHRHANGLPNRTR